MPHVMRNVVIGGHIRIFSVREKWFFSRTEKMLGRKEPAPGPVNAANMPINTETYSDNFVDIGVGILLATFKLTGGLRTLDDITTISHATGKNVEGKV
ncbi:hypothetical protein TNIN_212251 [Trichonephila inaurata madagascariensis]|uniref:Uncharacterized protein n=1 Tax=Trichonephila inaurata madagascariensis TaxID=2747483 RepID=A0A8X6X3F0_9ARAC|nr:hypothetical protein TNIN_212251 [Trichonephila inaurata madagascariensis]